MAEEHKNDKKNKQIFTFTQSVSISALTFIVGNAFNYFITKDAYIPLVEKTRIEYVNKDTLPDLVLGNSEIYLQRKDGGFESYKSIVEAEQAKMKDSLDNKIKNLATERTNLDAIYRTKMDSINTIYAK